MTATALDLYVAGFRRQALAGAGPAARIVDEPELIGVVRDAGQHVSLLVLDDACREQLDFLLSARPSGVLTVGPNAAEVSASLTMSGEWTVSEPEAMICRDLTAVPELALPAPLRLEALPLEASPGSRLRAAAEIAVRADPTLELTAEQLAVHLCMMTPAPQLFGAVDADGMIRATAGCRVIGADAAVLFVNTEPAWQRRGIGASMTASVLWCAHAIGGRSASLHATPAGSSIYRRLGFESAGTLTVLSRHADD